VIIKIYNEAHTEMEKLWRRFCTHTDYFYPLDSKANRA